MRKARIIMIARTLSRVAARTASGEAAGVAGSARAWMAAAVFFSTAGQKPVERGQGLGADFRRGAGPGGIGGGGRHRRRVLVQAFEEGAPVGSDGAGVAGPLRLQLLHEAGVAAVEEAGFAQNLVDASAVVRHRSHTSGRLSPAPGN
jgi:hypothetical protein